MEGHCLWRAYKWKANSIVLSYSMSVQEGILAGKISYNVRITKIVGSIFNKMDDPNIFTPIV